MSELVEFWPDVVINEVKKRWENDFKSRTGLWQDIEAKPKRQNNAVRMRQVFMKEMTKLTGKQDLDGINPANLDMAGVRQMKAFEIKADLPLLQDREAAEKARLAEERERQLKERNERELKEQREKEAAEKAEKAKEENVQQARQERRGERRCSAEEQGAADGGERGAVGEDQRT